MKCGETKSAGKLGPNQFDKRVCRCGANSDFSIMKPLKLYNPLKNPLQIPGPGASGRELPQVVAEALKRTTTWKLDLGNNEIGDQGAEAPPLRVAVSLDGNFR